MYSVLPIFYFISIHHVLILLNKCIKIAHFARVAGGKMGFIQGKATIKAKGVFDTNIKDSGIFFCQNTYSEVTICAAIMYETNTGAILNKSNNVNFFSKGDTPLSVYRESLNESILLYNNLEKSEMNVYYTFIKCI